MIQYIERSLIVYNDGNGFGLRIKGHSPVFVEHVHENGAAWRAGVRKFDKICKVNGIPVLYLNHRDVVLMFKSCVKFVGLTLISQLGSQDSINNDEQTQKTFLTSSSSSSSLLPSLTEFSSILSNNKTLSPIFNRSCSTNNQRQRNTTANINFDEQANMHCNTVQLSSLRIDNNQQQQQQAKRSESVTAWSPSCVSKKFRIAQQDNNSNFANNILHENKNDNYSMTTSSATSTLTNNNFTCLCCQSPLGETTDSLTCYRCKLTHANYSLNKRFVHLSSSFNENKLNSYTQQNQQQQQHQLMQQQFVDERGAFVGDLNSKLKAQKANCRTLPNNQSEHTHYASKAAIVDNNLKSQQTTTTNTITTATKPKQVTNKRLEIIKELIDTEKNHTEKLKCLDELFYKPIKTDKLMTSEQLKSVFSCHRQLFRIHRQIYKTLISARFNINDEPLIGSALVEIFEGDLRKKLDKASCVFCSNQATNVELLNKLLRRDTKVGQFFAQVSNNQTIGRLGVKDLLAACFQRLTKYPLLLENLLKSTPTSEALAAAAKHSTSASSDQFNDKTTSEIIALTFSEERQFIARALHQSRQILVNVNEAIKQATSQQKLKEIWKRTDKHPGVLRIDITKQQVIHEGPLTLRLSKRSFEVYVLLLNDYIVILNRDGQDKYRLKYFSPDGKFGQQSVYSPIFVIDEHLTTRDAATDENGFYLLCKRKEDSRIYEFSSRSPAERMKWRDKIHWTVDRQVNKSESDLDRRLSSVSTITKSSSETSYQPEFLPSSQATQESLLIDKSKKNDAIENTDDNINNKSHNDDEDDDDEYGSKIEGTISYVEDDGIVMPSNITYSTTTINKAIQIKVSCRNERLITDDFNRLFEHQIDIARR